MLIDGLYCPRLIEGAVVAPIANGEVMVACASRAEALRLNASAAVVVSLCNGNLSIRDIAALLSETQGIESRRAVEDVTELVQQLSDEGLLQEPREL